MSRRKGSSPRTLVMYSTLDGSSYSWASTNELATVLMQEYAVSDVRARHLVVQWHKARKNQRYTVGRNTYYCSRRQLEPTLSVRAIEAWRTLPQAFKRHTPIRKYPDELREEMILLATLAYKGYAKAQEKYNRLARKNRLQVINVIKTK